MSFQYSNILKQKLLMIYYSCLAGALLHWSMPMSVLLKVGIHFVGCLITEIELEVT